MYYRVLQELCTNYVDSKGFRKWLPPSGGELVALGGPLRFRKGGFLI